MNLPVKSILVTILVACIVASIDGFIPISSKPMTFSSHTTCNNPVTRTFTKVANDNGNDSVNSDSPAESITTTGEGFNSATVGKQLSQLWNMSVPFFKEGRNAKILFAGLIVLTLANSGVSVAFSYIGRDFWTALSLKDPEQFSIMLQRFLLALIAGVPVTVFYRFQREKLALAWREWMTLRVMDIYYAGQTYYALEAEREIDNPDQRIADDVRSFTKVSLEFLITIVTSVIDLCSFSIILYKIYPQLFVAIIAYAGAGTAIATALGSPLVKLNFGQLQREADFRYSLIRMRENSESIAFYGGEAVELGEIQRRFKLALDNFADIIKAQRNLEFFTVSYRYLIQVLPSFVVAPLYFKGQIELGVVSQSYGAFNHILGDLSIIINQFEALSQFSAGVQRLDTFLRRMADDDSEELHTDKTEKLSILALPVETRDIKQKWSSNELPGIQVHISSMANLSVRNVTVATPGGSRVLSTGVSFDLPPGGRLLVVGQSGAGKSSLLRAVAGLWGAGSGEIKRPPNDEIFFLPQRPYCTLGPLKDQITYPHRLPGEPTDQELLALLERVGLPNLASLAGEGDEIRGLNAVKDWSDMLSLGEQQRLAFARLVYNMPRLAILDEATSALDLACEKRMYELLGEIKDLSYLSVGHRPSLLQYHNMKLHLKAGKNVSEQSLEKIINTSSQTSL